MAQVAPAAAAELLPCQRDSYLRTVQATVRSCREAKAALGSGGSGGKKKDKSKSKAPVQALFEVRARGPQSGGKTSRGAGLSGCPALPPAAPRRCRCDRAAIVCRGRSACVEGAGRHEGARVAAACSDVLDSRAAPREGSCVGVRIFTVDSAASVVSL